MKLGTSSLHKSVSIKSALTVMFLTASSASAADQGTGLSPVALKVFNYCIDAAREGKQLTEKQLATELPPVLEEFSDFARGNLKIEIEDDFECFIQIPAKSFDPAKLRDSLATAQASRFNGRVNSCRWLIGVQGGRASVLECSFKSNSDPANIFQINIGIIPVESAMFWIEPLVIYDADGYIKRVN